jgi:hypothetical protein
MSEQIAEKYELKVSSEETPPKTDPGLSFKKRLQACRWIESARCPVITENSVRISTQHHCGTLIADLVDELATVPTIALDLEDWQPLRRTVSMLAYSLYSPALGKINFVPVVIVKQHKAVHIWHFVSDAIFQFLALFLLLLW